MASPKLNPRLIPIKKLVVDIRKGALLRTYYIKPETLMKMVERLRSEPIKQYLVKVPMAEKVDLFKQTENITIFRQNFKDNKTFDAVSERFAVKDRLELENPNNTKNNYALGIINFISTIDKSYIKTLSRDLKKTTLDYQGVQENIKFSKVSVKAGQEIKENNQAEVSEAQSTEQSNINEFDKLKKKTSKKKEKPNAVTYIAIPKYKLIKGKNPIKAGDSLSKIINYMNPQKDKMLEIYKKILGSDLKDKSYIAHNTLFAVSTYDKTRDISVPLIQSLLSDGLMTLKNNGEERQFISYPNLLQLLAILSYLDPSSYKDLYSVYKENDDIGIFDINFSSVDTYLSGRYPYDTFKTYAISYVNDNELDELVYSALYSLLLIAKYEDINRLITDVLLNTDDKRKALKLLSVASGNINLNSKNISIFMNQFEDLFNLEFTLNMFKSFCFGKTALNNIPIEFFLTIHKVNYIKQKYFGIKSQYLCYDTIYKMDAHRVSPTLISKLIPVMDKILIQFEQETINGTKSINYEKDKLYIPIFTSSLIEKDTIFSRIPPIYIAFDDVAFIDEYEGIKDMISIGKDKVKPIYTDSNGAYLILPFI